MTKAAFLSVKKKIIGDQLLKIYKHGPGILKALKPSSLFDETLEQEKRRRGLWVYLHLLRMMFVLHSTFLVTLELDEFGAKFVGDLYILVLFFFQFSTSITTFHLGKVTPFQMDFYKTLFKISPTHALSITVVTRVASTL